MAENDTKMTQLTEEEWEKLEMSSHQQQRKFLQKYKVKIEPVSSKQRNVRKGDHLSHPGAFGKLYEHHLLVYEVDDNNIYYYDLTVPRDNLRDSLLAASRSNLSGLGKVGAGSKTYEELEAKQAKKHIWALERYSVDEVIARAQSRMNESEYHLTKRNCEHYVTWCKFNLSASLQITSTLETASHVADNVSVVEWKDGFYPQPCLAVNWEGLLNREDQRSRQMHGSKQEAQEVQRTISTCVPLGQGQGNTTSVLNTFGQRLGLRLERRMETNIPTDLSGFVQGLVLGPVRGEVLGRREETNPKGDFSKEGQCTETKPFS